MYETKSNLHQSLADARSEHAQIVRYQIYKFIMCRSKHLKNIINLSLRPISSQSPIRNLAKYKRSFDPESISRGRLHSQHAL